MNVPKIYHVDNFLEVEDADKFEEGIKNLFPEWFNYCLLSAGCGKEFFDYYDGLEESEQFLNLNDKCTNSYNNGFFAYKFQRTHRPHFDDCGCKLCDMHDLFNSPEILQRMSDIIGEEVTDITESFVSKYKKGDYLTVHQDTLKGDYAFIYQMTKDWKPVYGGLLHFVNDNKVTTTIVPEYNTITIFKIKDAPNTDHFVSEITVDKTRMAYTGWFSVKNKE